MKILHVLETSIPNLVGYTIRAKYIVENQKKNGMEPVVVTSPFFKGKVPERKFEEIAGVRYYRTNDIKMPVSDMNKLLSYWIRYRMIQKYKNAVLEIAKKEKPDIIHAHSSYTNGHAANYVSKTLGIPSIYELRTLWGEAAVVEDGLRPNSLKYKIVWNLELKAMKQARRVIAISRGIKKEIIKRGIVPEKVDLLPNGVDSDIFVPIERNHDFIVKYRLEDCFVMGYIGSIRKLEGLSYLVDVFPMIKEKNRNIKLVIVGDGPERENLKKQAKSLNINDIVFTGNVPHDKILEYYSVIDLFVFPRINAKINQTVTPLKPLEVMATEKVVLASDVGGLAELVQDGKTGVLFKAEDAHDLAEKIIELVQNKQRRVVLGKEARKWIVKNRQWKNLAGQYLPIYKRMLN